MPQKKKTTLMHKLKEMRRKKREAQTDFEFVLNPDGTTTRVPKIKTEVRET